MKIKNCSSEQLKLLFKKYKQKFKNSSSDEEKRKYRKRCLKIKSEIQGRACQKEKESDVKQSNSPDVSDIIANYRKYRPEPLKNKKSSQNSKIKLTSIRKLKRKAPSSLSFRKLRKPKRK